MKNLQRIFVAINLPHDIKKYLAGFEKQWPDLPARWVIPDNLHVTLVFLGDITNEELGETCMIVKNIAGQQPSFNITLRRVAYGPEGKIPPRFVWAEGEKSGELSSLKKNLESALLEKVNFKPEERSFSPHVTLARVNTFPWRQINPEERPEVNENIDLTFTVESIEVMESELKRGGPQYTIIESHALQS